MRRKAERAARKKPNEYQSAKVTVKGSEMTVEELSKQIGVKVDLLIEWCDARTLDIQKAVIDEVDKQLWQAENKITAINVLVACKACLLAFGDLKTVQKGLPRLLAKMGTASDYLEERGARAVYDELVNQYGISINFEDFDLSTLFDAEGQAETISKMIRERLGHESDGEH